jgi:hypothetical protein
MSVLLDWARAIVELIKARRARRLRGKRFPHRWNVTTYPQRCEYCEQVRSVMNDEANCPVKRVRRPSARPRGTHGISK